MATIAPSPSAAGEFAMSKEVQALLKSNGQSVVAAEAPPAALPSTTFATSASSEEKSVPTQQTNPPGLEATRKARVSQSASRIPQKAPRGFRTGIPRAQALCKRVAAKKHYPVGRLCAATAICAGKRRHARTSFEIYLKLAVRQLAWH